MKREEVERAIKRLTAMNVLRTVDDETFILDRRFGDEVKRALVELRDVEDPLSSAVILALVRWRHNTMGEGYPEDELIDDAAVVYAFIVSSRTFLARGVGREEG